MHTDTSVLTLKVLYAPNITKAEANFLCPILQTFINLFILLAAKRSFIDLNLNIRGSLYCPPKLKLIIYCHNEFQALDANCVDCQ